MAVEYYALFHKLAGPGSDPLRQGGAARISGQPTKIE